MSVTRATALEIILSSASEDDLELWLEYSAVQSADTTQTRLYYLRADGTQVYVTAPFQFPITLLDEFSPFAERRAGHIRLDRTDDHRIREAVGESPLPLPEVGGTSLK